MYRILVLAGLFAAAAATAGRSPNAELVEEYLAKAGSSTKFSTNTILDALLDAPSLARRYGYPLEVHSVVSSDGYILELHRIPHGRDNNNRPGPGRPPVLVMHGLLSSSADFLVLGPGDALAYLLAEEGYDVWLGNARGNYYSRRHVSLDPDDESQAFWEFSWEQIGLYDVAAFVDYITFATGQPKMHYIGHSQGGTVFLVLNSLRPEYNEKFISFQGLAPASYFDHNDHIVFKNLAPYEVIIENLAFRFGMAELIPKSEILKWIGIAFCANVSPFQPLCAGAIDLANLGDTFNTSMIPVFLGHAPAGASIRQLAHYGQSIRRKAFARYNFDPITNLRLYRSLTPPQFDLSKITVPTYLHYGLADAEVNWQDVHLLAERLGNTVGLYQAERESFNHYEFIWGKNIKEEVFDKLFQLLKDAENEV